MFPFKHFFFPELPLLPFPKQTLHTATPKDDRSPEIFFPQGLVCGIKICKESFFTFSPFVISHRLLRYTPLSESSYNRPVFYYSAENSEIFYYLVTFSHVKSSAELVIFILSLSRAVRGHSFALRRTRPDVIFRLRLKVTLLDERTSQFDSCTDRKLSKEILVN